MSMDHLDDPKSSIEQFFEPASIFLRNEYAYSSLNLNQNVRELLYLGPIEPTFPVRFPLPELTAVQKCAPSPLGMDTQMAPWKFGWILEWCLGIKREKQGKKRVLGVKEKKEVII